MDQYGLERKLDMLAIGDCEKKEPNDNSTSITPSSSEVSNQCMESCKSLTEVGIHSTSGQAVPLDAQKSLVQIKDLLTTSGSRDYSTFIGQLSEIIMGYDAHQSLEKEFDDYLIKRTQNIIAEALEVGDDPTLQKFYFSKPILAAADTDDIKKFNEKREADRILLEKVMSIHLCAKHILQNLAFEDLLNCSLMGKSWQKAARDILQRDRHCFISVRSSTSCRKLRQLTGLLERSKGVNIPFNGLKISRACSSKCQNDDQRYSDDMSCAISFLDKLTIKYLNLDNWDVKRDCPLFHVIRELFQHHSNDLVELTFRKIAFPINEIEAGLIQMFLNDDPPEARASSSFSNLRQIILRRDTWRRHSLEFVADIIRRAPNLQEIRGHVTPALTPIVMEEKGIQFVKEFQFIDVSEEALDQCLDFVERGPRLKEMVVAHKISRFLAEGGTGMLRRIYQTSQNSLTTLELTHADLIDFIPGGGNHQPMPALPHLTQLQLHYDSRCDGIVGDGVVFSLMKIDFSTIFPKLHSIIMDTCYWHLPSSFDEILTDLDIERCQNAPEHSNHFSVTRLKFDSKVEKGNEEKYLIEHFPWNIFPNLTHFQIKSPKNAVDLFTRLWTECPNLESITMTKVQDGSIWGNLDPLFTGIFEEDCKLLRDKGDYSKYQELQQQAQNSILNLKKLKLLRLHIIHNPFECDIRQVNQRRNNNVLLTEVTAKCAFAQMPGLKVEISRLKCIQSRCFGKRCYLDLDCLHPFVTFVPFIDKIGSAPAPPGWDYTF